MKRFSYRKAALLGLVIILMSTLLSGCKIHVNTNKYTKTVASNLDVKLEAYKTDLYDSSGAMASNEGIRKYLVNWADSKGIYYYEDNNNNIIMSVDAGENYQNAVPTVIVCPYDADQFSDYVNAMAMSLYLVKNGDETGKLTVIFAEENGHDFSGIQNISKGFFADDARVIVLNGDETGSFDIASAQGALFQFTQSVSYTEPEYTKAYRITMTGLGTHQNGENFSQTNNPIERFRELLVSLGNSNISYEIASIQGGSPDALSADTCEMTIVITPDREDKFIDRMTSATEKFNADDSQIHPGASYTFEETELPDQVLTSESASQFVNFMYTLPRGAFASDENGTSAINNICYINMTSEDIQIYSIGHSLNEETMQTIIDTEMAFCNLSDVDFQQLENIPGWAGSSEEETGFANLIANSYRQYTGKTLTYSNTLSTTSAGYIKERNENCEIIVITVNDTDLTNCTGTILEYLIQNMDRNI